MKDKHLIELIDVSKAYGGDVALSHVDLYIKDGEFLTLLGPSGCGKTTMLRLIAGFIMPDEGRIEMGGTDIANTPPYLRQVNTVFLREVHKFRDLCLLERNALGLGGDPGVPRSAEYLADTSGAAQSVHNGVLAATATDNQHVLGQERVQHYRFAVTLVR